ncbi:MAG: PhoH family protein [Brockia lithotrophica]|nr:PhoH family protein [Brockia lithotrophica]
MGAAVKPIRLLHPGEGLSLFGPHDRYLRRIEEAFPVRVVLRGDEVQLLGDEDTVRVVGSLLEVLVALVRRGHALSEHDVLYAIRLTEEGDPRRLFVLFEEELTRTVRGRPVRALTLGQLYYVQELRRRDIVFAVGPAGTGKTYLAVVFAVKALRSHEVRRIVLTRPAVEAGERLGFLPGDLQEKVDPYLRPLYDALYDLLGADVVAKAIERGTIEIAPLAYMRGRTLDEAFVILDEAQNTTPAQMKMFLTRLGAGSRMVITGDLTQVDLARGEVSGLEDALGRLKDIPEIGIVTLHEADVVRHPLVEKIVRAYEGERST